LLIINLGLNLEFTPAYLNLRQPSPIGLNLEFGIWFNRTWNSEIISSGNA